ncbi:proteoglycan 4 isoform X5 [Orussus abietinus]|uniref:proteoglycan 4 isoform X5 n=1 Tax=Orussus abietinus TaxID=222816 RepID=UPI0006253565|nr:proteoglycan 4 isoform X5 [Orussus abietinus]
MAAPQASSRLEMLQARFQQKQLQEKEQKLLQLYDQQQLRAHQVAQRGSAGSTGSSNGSMVSHQTITRTTTSHSTSTSQGGKVRQMFDERRQTTVKGIDRSYPLEPLDKSRKHPIDNGVTSSRTNPLVNRHSVTVKKLVRADVNSNVNGGKPVVSYHEEMTTSFDDGTEFGDENHDDGLINGHRNSIRSEVQVEEVIDDDTIERNRMMAKIHLMGFDRTLKHRVGNNLENEQFPEDPMLDFPDKPKRTIGKKLSQAEARLERFKNANSRRTIANRTTSTSRKPADSSGSTSRLNKSPSPDPAARKEMKNSTSTRRSTPTSPPKSPDANNRASMDLRNEPTTSRRSPPNIPRNRENRRPALETSKSTDVVDGPDLQNDSCIPERSNSQVQREEDDSNSRKRGDAFVVEFDDLEKKSRENEAPKKPAPKKRSQEKSATLQKQASPPTTTPRPLSSLSNSSSTGSSRSPGSVGAKGRMATKARHPAAAAGSRGPPTGRSGPGAVSNDTLVPCKVCGRRFAQDRVGLHEQICSKTGQKKRKQFDAMMFRVKGTELEPFVKKSTLKKPEPKSKKSDPKSNWRRKHEDFINAIRSAKQVQAHLAAGGKLSDLPPPPASDTSDYIQCPHCGRKFNQGAAERHIPKCQHMLHNKPNPRAPPKPKR